MLHGEPETCSQESERADPVMLEASSRPSASPSERQERDQDVPTGPYVVRLLEAKWGPPRSSGANTPTLNLFPPSWRITD